MVDKLYTKKFLKILLLLVTACAVGMKDGRVLDQDISASSNWDERHADRFARLDFQKGPNSIGAWSSGKNRGPRI